PAQTPPRDPGHRVSLSRWGGDGWNFFTRRWPIWFRDAPAPNTELSEPQKMGLATRGRDCVQKARVLLFLPPPQRAVAKRRGLNLGSFGGLLGASETAGREPPRDEQGHGASSPLVEKVGGGRIGHGRHSPSDEAIIGSRKMREIHLESEPSSHPSGHLGWVRGHELEGVPSPLGVKDM